MRILTILCLAISAVLHSSCHNSYPDLPNGMYAEIITTKGTAIAELYHHATPVTVSNFVSLAEGTNTMVDEAYKGKKFFNDLSFYRVVKNATLQTGDPFANGKGNPGYKFPNEIVDTLKHDAKGLLTMAIARPNTNGSQFMITLKPLSLYDGKNTIFGKIVQGMEVMEDIGSSELKGTRPVEDIRIKEVNIIRKGEAAEDFDAATTFEEKLEHFAEVKAEKERLATARKTALLTKFSELKTQTEPLQSGLQVAFTSRGNGKKPALGSKVSVNYTLYLEDGSIIDTNKANVAIAEGIYNERKAANPGYIPMRTTYSQEAKLIPGLVEGIQQMKYGDQAIFFVPGYLGYGEKGTATIPANAPLIFDIELVDPEATGDTQNLAEGVYAEIVTSMGTAIAQLYFEATPMTVANFVSLAEGTNTRVKDTYQGKKFYDGIIFHRVIKDFMIQGGDPQQNGRGGPGYSFPDEIVDSLTHHSKGILSMANSGPDTNGSQFFITLKQTPWLNGKHTVFGKIVSGQEIIDAIGLVPVNNTRPVTPVSIKKINIIRKGKKAKAFNAKKVFDKSLTTIEKAKIKAEKEQRKQNQATISKHEKLKKKAEVLPSGLAMIKTVEGSGAQPKKGATVLLNYAGYLTNGKLFDTNIEEIAKANGTYSPERASRSGGYAPIPMPYTAQARMIEGFKEGVLNMKVGDKATLFIPGKLGYGERGSGPIPPNADLIFEVEVTGIR